MKVNMQVPHQDGSTFEGTFVLIIRVHVRHVHVGFIQNKVGLLYSYPPPKSSTVHTCSSHVRVCCSRVPYTYPRMWTFFCKNKVFRTFVKVTYCRGIHKYDTKVYMSNLQKLLVSSRQQHLWSPLLRRLNATGVSW